MCTTQSTTTDEESQQSDPMNPKTYHEFKVAVQLIQLPREIYYGFIYRYAGDILLDIAQSTQAKVGRELGLHQSKMSILVQMLNQIVLARHA